MSNKSIVRYNLKECDKAFFTPGIYYIAKRHNNAPYLTTNDWQAYVYTNKSIILMDIHKCIRDWYTYNILDAHKFEILVRIDI